jgi:uncharacterized sporulation protein YeaH/YhbH (DUF444 family)
MSNSTVIDRRLNGKHRSLPNRERFIRRYKSQLKRAVSDVATNTSIADISKDGKVRVRVPSREVSEPTFVYGEGGDRERVIPGNRDFSPGDRVPRPRKDGKGEGGNKPGQGESEDDFNFVLSRDEFLSLYFDDLELPELLRKELSTVRLMKSKNAGFTHSGPSTALSVMRTMKASLARRIALLPVAEEEDEDQDQGDAKENAEPALYSGELPPHAKKRAPYVPFLDEIDLRYRHRVQVPEPSTNAVMFCLMDVSASMDEAKKDLAKRFYTLLYLFLTRKYESVDLVFIRHTDEAEEVDEQSFFYGNKSGGTEIMPAVELMQEIVVKRYPPALWNVYVAQASDGDASDRDARACTAFLQQHLLPYVRYYAYVETMPSAMLGIHRASDLWDAYETLAQRFDGFFAMRRLYSRRDIYPVFRGLFEKRGAGMPHPHS